MTGGRTAVVTGGTRGIGAAVSLALARAGYRVHAIYARNRAAAEELEERARQEALALRSVRADLADEERVDGLVAALAGDGAPLDVLVHSAASGVHREALELTTKHLAWTLGVNVFAAHRLVRGLASLMRPGARIVGITSQGATHALPYYAAVGASKGALDALFRHYARELAPRGIAVNLVCPGMIATGALDALPAGHARAEWARAQTPTGRLTTPDEVAQVVLFLCSPGAGQIVGQTLVVDGGRELAGLVPPATD